MTEYGQIKAVNFSSLKHLAVSPKLYRWRIDHPEPRKQAWVTGGAIHCLLFEPGKFDSRYAMYDGMRRGKDWDKWVAEHPGVESLKPDELEHAQQTVAAIRAHKRAAQIIDGCRFEEATTWVDTETGLACKGRLDAIHPTYLVDVKSTKGIVPRAFERDSVKYLYHAQLAWYQDGAVAAGKIPGDVRPYLISVEKDGPYDVVVYQFTEAALLIGRAVYRALMTKLVQCQAADWWPGIAEDVLPLDVPAYLEGVAVETESEDF